MFHPRKFWINIYVDPRLHNRGIGSKIYEKRMEELRELDATTVWAMNKADLPTQYQFFRKRGFEEKMRLWESRLDTRSTEPERFREYTEKMSREGITLATLAEENNRNPEALRKINDLLMVVCADMPNITPFTPISFEQWEAFELKSPRHLPEAYMLAKQSSAYVALSYSRKSEKEHRVLNQGDTGASRDYRGRGITISSK